MLQVFFYAVQDMINNGIKEADPAATGPAST